MKIQQFTPTIQRLLRLLLPALLLALVIAPWPPARLAAQHAPAGVLSPDGMRGVSFVHVPSAPFGSDQAADSLRRLAATGANWVSIVVPFRTNSSHEANFYRSANDPAD